MTSQAAREPVLCQLYRPTFVLYFYSEIWLKIGYIFRFSRAVCRPYLLRKLARHASPSDRLQTLKTSEMRTVNTPQGGSVKCMTGNLRRSSALFSVKRAL